MSDPRPQSPTSTEEHEGTEDFSALSIKILALCDSLNLGPISIERLRGGDYNRIIGLKSPTAEYILRFPRSQGPNMDPNGSRTILAQVAVLGYLKDKLPVPVIQAYDSSPDNPLCSPYVIQSRVSGLPLNRVYDGLPVAEKIQIIDQWINLMSKMENIKFGDAGRLIASPAMPRHSSTSLGILETPCIMGFAVGFGIEGWCPPGQLWETEESSDLGELLSSHLHSWILFELATSPDNPADSKGPADPKYPKYKLLVIPFLRELKDVLRQMKSKGFLDAHHPPSLVLHHSDLEPRNVMVGKDDNGIWKITGVLDWDDPLATPSVITQKPPVWMWDSREVDDEGEWLGDDVDARRAHDLSEDEKLLKEHFDTSIEKLIPGYTAGAYREGRWIRRLWRFAMDGFSSNEDVKRYDTFMEDWEKEMNEDIES